MNLRIRIAAAAAATLLAAPALAADRAQDCTVCADPTWPSLQNLMPAIPLTAPAAEDGTAVPGDATWLVASNRSPGVGVSASASTRGGVYADPTWPSMGTPAAGIAATRQEAVPAPKPAAPKSAQVAAR